jgi:phage-related minor tail protein
MSYVKHEEFEYVDRNFNKIKGILIHLDDQMPKIDCNFKKLKEEINILNLKIEGIEAYLAFNSKPSKPKSKKTKRTKKVRLRKGDTIRIERY